MVGRGADFQNSPSAKVLKGGGGGGGVYLASSKQVTAFDGFKDIGGDVGLGRKVGLCQGLLHFLHIHQTEGPLLP